MKKREKDLEATQMGKPIDSPVDYGLTTEQVEIQVQSGQSNADNGVHSKPYGQIIWDNTMTYFNPVSYTHLSSPSWKDTPAFA